MEEQKSARETWNNKGNKRYKRLKPDMRPGRSIGFREGIEGTRGLDQEAKET